MSVHYKFKSGKERHTVIFDGLQISVKDLKNEIMKQRKIGKSSDLDLQISNPQTGEVYELDSTLIPKNTTVDIARIPVSANHKKYRDRHENNSFKISNSPSHVELNKIIKSSNLSTSYGTEEEKIKAMMSQSTQEYDSSKYVKHRGIVGPLPSNYTCYRCGQSGHYIKLCPTNNFDTKRSTGIPRSFMVSVNADQKGALLTSSGDYAVPIIDFKAYKEVKKEKPPFSPNNESDKEIVVSLEIPQDLKCNLCQNLLQDAVLIPCCGNSFCDECIRSLLLESESHECPTCKELNVSPDTLIPNRYLRICVNKFNNKTIQQNEKNICIEDNINETKQLKNGINIENVEMKVIDKINDIELKNELIQNDSDINKDEIKLSSSKKEKITQNAIEIQPIDQPVIVSNETIPLKVEQTKDLIDTGIDSPKEGQSFNIPKVNQHLKSYEANEDHNQTEVNRIITQPHYQNNHLLPMPLYSRPHGMIGPIHTIQTPMNHQSSHTLFGRSQAIPMHPHNYPRHGLTKEQYFFRPMADPRAFHNGLSHVSSYGFASQMRPNAYPNPYGYMGPNSYPPNSMYQTFDFNQQISDARPPGTVPIVSDNIYQYCKPDYDDYEDKMNRFTRQLESRPTLTSKVRSITRSRSRSHSRSRSKTSFESSSTYSSYSPRKRSHSRDHYRRRSPSPSHKHNKRGFRSRRSRSPHYKDSSRISVRPKRGENRDKRFDKYERNDSHRSHRSKDKIKDLKRTHDSRLNHKSSLEKIRKNNKNIGSDDDIRHKSNSETQLKEENHEVFEKIENKSEINTVNEDVNNSHKVESVSKKLMPTINDNFDNVENKLIELKMKIEVKRDKIESEKRKERPKKHHKHQNHRNIEKSDEKLNKKSKKKHKYKNNRKEK